MQIADETIWFDFFVIIIVFSIILIKVFLFMWYKSRKNKLICFCSCYQMITKRAFISHIVCILKAVAQHG